MNHLILRRIRKKPRETLINIPKEFINFFGWRHGEEIKFTYWKEKHALVLQSYEDILRAIAIERKREEEEQAKEEERIKDKMKELERDKEENNHNRQYE